MRGLGQLREPNSRIDVIAKDGLGSMNIAGEDRFHAFAQQFFPKFRIPLNA